MWSRLREKKVRRVIFWCAVLVGFGLALHLFLLYQQVEESFTQKDEFQPTLLFSDITTIRLNEARKKIETRLSQLGYTVQKDATQTSFTLHDRKYPEYLIPEDHPTLKLYNTPIVLKFDAEGSAGKLSTISTTAGDIPDLILEPELVSRITRSTQLQIREYVEFETIPANVWQAIIAIEDRHFLDHPGIDFRAIARAIWVDIKTQSFAQGGSTITQQLVKNLTARRTKNIFKKINELLLAPILEIRFSKEEILERYLNEVYLGQVGALEIHGMAEGAKYFFGKKLENVNLAEAALLAGLIRGAAYYSPYRYLDRALERQRLVLSKMVETGALSAEEAAIATKTKIRLVPPPKVSNQAPYFSDYVKAELIDRLSSKLSEEEVINSGFSIYTTLDPQLNLAAQAAVGAGVKRLAPSVPKNSKDGNASPLRVEGALATVDHHTGYIRALVGGSDYSTTTFNRILNMRRQVGSTFKPVVYLSAFEHGIGPGTPFFDGRWKLIYNRDKQEWSPRNYKEEYRGWVSAHEALIFSINTVAARLGIQVGLDTVLDTAKRLQIGAPMEKVPALALGVVEMTPIDVLKLYSLFANRGVQDELTVIRAIVQPDGKTFARFILHPKQVFDQAPIDLLNEMLKDVFARGTAAPAAAMGFDRPAAGKTGTTNDYRDAWFSGFTPELTTVVWVGIDEGVNVDEKGKSKVHLTGAGAALPIWVDFMKRALEGEPISEMPTPDTIVTKNIDRYSGKLASFTCSSSQVVSEKYMAGKEPTETDCASSWPAEPAKEVKVDSL